jgi:6-phosphogluconolactonase (cycloisomerase 2 family)
MSSNEADFEHASAGAVQRRTLLKAALPVALAGSSLARAAQEAKTPKGKSLFAYVGTYSSPQGPEGSKGRGEGIYLVRADMTTGALTPVERFKNDSNPAWLAFNSTKTHVYSANETNTYEGQKSGSVGAYAVDRATGRLTLVNTVSSRGAGPAHLSVHPSDRFVLVANYAGGTIAVLPIQANGGLGEATDVKEDPGPVGAEHAASAPPGSFAISGHDRPHAHMIQSDPSGRFVLHTDLATDQIYIWKFDVQTGKLTPAAEPSVKVPSGDGPRHFTFHPNGRWLYCLQEEASTLMLFDYDGQTGKLSEKQTLSTLPKGFTGTNFTSEVAISPDGRFVYAANRLHDSIAYFAIASDGRLSFAGEEWTRGDYPRSFTIDPSGNFLYSCNQRADAVATFRVNRRTGALTFTGQYTPVGTPGIIIFLT